MDKPFSPGRWGVVHTHPHKEQLALKNLEVQAFEAYCPMKRSRIRHARKSQDVLRPLFPGYLFVHLDKPAQSWRSISSTRGVKSLLCTGGRLQYLPDGFVDCLKAREIEGAVLRTQTPFHVGQHVQIAGGPFHGLAATIVDMDERDRLILLMDLLKRETRVKVNAGDVTDCAINDP